jgi:hypothetical protein
MGYELYSSVGLVKNTEILCLLAHSLGVLRHLCPALAGCTFFIVSQSETSLELNLRESEGSVLVCEYHFSG